MSDRDELTDYESDIKEYTDFIHAGIDYRIEKIIALARADERQLIAEAMLSEEVYRVMADGVDRLLPEAERDMRAALAAAGITGAGQEGGEGE